MTIAIVLLIVFMIVWAFILGCAELEHREEEWQREHPPDGKKNGGR